jgi:hypothetical protein
MTDIPRLRELEEDSQAELNATHEIRPYHHITTEHTLYQFNVHDSSSAHDRSPDHFRYTSFFLFLPCALCSNSSSSSRLGTLLFSANQQLPSTSTIISITGIINKHDLFGDHQDHGQLLSSISTRRSASNTSRFEIARRLG